MYSYKNLSALLCILLAFMLAGCGTKGDLNIPKAYQKYYENK